MDFWLCEVEYRYATLALEIQVGVEFRVAAMANLDVLGFFCYCSCTTRLGESIPSTSMAQCDPYCRYVVS